MSESSEWPDEIWVTEIDHEYAPAGYYYLSQPDGGEPYIHHQILDDQRRYTKHMIEQARLAGLKEGYERADLAPQQVTVKPLEWSVAARDEAGPTRFAAEATQHAYMVECCGDFWTCSSDETFVEYLEPNGEQKAKAAAQSDYERRILSALDQRPVTVAEWQPIETAPKDGKILAMKNGEVFVSWLVDYHHTGPRWTYHALDGLWPWLPTHWMPLPEPPRALADEDAPNDNG